MKYPNPFLTSKDIAPYLYLTEYSGIYLNDYGTNNRYVSIPINADQNSDTYIAAVQLWFRYPYKTFTASFPMIDIIGSSASVNFICTPESGGGRAKVDITGDFVCWQNGYSIQDPIAYPSEWQAINVSFPNLINVSNFSGEIRLYSGMVFNSIEIYSFKGDPSNIFDANNEYTMDGSSIYNHKVGTSLVSVEDFGSIQVFSNGVDVFTDVIWQKFEKNVV